MANLLNFEVSGTLTDKKFNNVVRAIMDFADKQLLKYHHLIDDKKYKRYHEIHGYLEQGLNKKYYAVSKRTFVCDLMDLTYQFPIKAPMVRKKVKDYLESQINMYSLNERPYTNAIPGYPYKSTNIVDLLEEVEIVRKERYESGLSRQKYNGR
ncbi:MAG: hypothetical protein IKN73_02485 [Alphaproteobacteria bacterium]|nr:hypothetical protein [Alphaproteobacteria bacterium]